MFKITEEIGEEFTSENEVNFVTGICFNLSISSMDYIRNAYREI